MADIVPNAPEHTAADIRAQATEWLVEREEAESWTEQKQAELENWLADLPAHLLAFWRAEDSWARAGLIAEMRPFAPRPESQPVRQSSSYVLKGVAALTAVVALGLGAMSYFGAPTQQSFATAIGGQKTITLTDGSRIELNTNSVLNIETGANRRRVTLVKGEAYFHIKHDAEHPFVVTASGHRIVDLGTEFLVRSNRNRLEVSLVEGRARVETANAHSDGSSTLMSPGDVVVATATALSITRKPVQELETAASWRRGLLIFKHTTLADAAAEFNRYNRQRLTISDPQTARLEIRGTYRANDVASFARLAGAVIGLKVEERGETIVLSRH